MDGQLTISGLRCAPTRFRRPRKPRALPRWQAINWLCAPAILLLLAATASAAAPRPEAAASTSRSARDDAVRSIPHEDMTPDAKAKAASVLSQVSIFRRLPTQVIECDPKLYLYLIEHPDLVVNMWEVMDVSDMTLDKTGPDTFRANDGAGTAGTMEYLYRSYDTHVMYAEGSYTGPLFVNPVHGKCLLVLKTAYSRNPDNRYFITCRLDAFIQLKNVGVELVAKTFQPLVGKTADHNFRETASFMSMISRSAEVKPQALQQLTSKLTKVTEEDREEFAELAHDLTVAAMERDAEKPITATPQSRPRRTVMKPQATPPSQNAKK